MELGNSYQQFCLTAFFFPTPNPPAEPNSLERLWEPALPMGMRKGNIPNPPVLVDRGICQDNAEHCWLAPAITYPLVF